MNLKLLLSLICCLLCFSQCFAQGQNVYFFNKSGKQVSVRDSADYIRIVNEPDSGLALYNVSEYYLNGKLKSVSKVLNKSGKQVNVRDSADYIRIVNEPDSGSVLYNVSEYYLNGKPKLLGKTSKVEYLVLEEQCIRYFPSGKKQQIANYKQNSLIGDVYYYYPNGVLYAYKQYISKKTISGDVIIDDFLIKACYDSTGKALVVDGNGYYIDYDNDFTNILGEGSVKSGLKDGKWKGSSGDKNDKVTFNEVYNSGKLKSGQSIDKDGQIYNYTEQKIGPCFKGGESFSHYLANHIRYPRHAEDNYIQGRVIIGFVVEKDGSLTNIKLLRTLSEDIGAEAMRVLQESPKCTAGLVYGRPVRIACTVPINFSLGEQ